MDSPIILQLVVLILLTLVQHNATRSVPYSVRHTRSIMEDDDDIREIIRPPPSPVTQLEHDEAGSKFTRNSFIPLLILLMNIHSLRAL